MPSPSSILSIEAIAHRLEFHRDTVTLEAARLIYTQLCTDALADGHEELPAQAHDAAAEIQHLIASGKPRGMVDSARHIGLVDDIIETALDIRDSTAAAYDRYSRHTARAAEALEILSAYSALLESADFELRTGTRTVTLSERTR